MNEDTPRPETATPIVKPPTPALRRTATLPDAPASKRASERPAPIPPEEPELEG